ncbi:hypothetical protein [Shewanella sp. NIFS-20-20]|uniref:hypothetical protein n=1 Tax=Shewanella sp. NIFS-20-20 TaxID=2853806 RepID=UPI001C496AC5|nr:hypothetical protein [Shewanella sp. NIFS-20-20]MBV7315475.1 hypothetical protein [Shewanella sp. NIFS-20-20]
MNKPLTEKQLKAREYYQRNKAKICQQKRTQYAANSAVSPTSKQVFNTSINACSSNFSETKKADKSKVVNPQKLIVRRSIEDIRIAQELGISMSDMASI